MGLNLGNILAGLGVGGAGSGSGSSGSSGTNPTNVVTSLLSGGANLLFPGLGNVLSGLLGNIQCWGNQAMTNATYNEWMGYVTSFLNWVAENGPIDKIQAEVNQYSYVVHQWQYVDYPKLKNPCSKQICLKCIDLVNKALDATYSVYNVTEPRTINMHGVNVQARTLISRKVDAPVIISNPTNPTTTVPTPVQPSTPTPVQPSTPTPVYPSTPTPVQPSTPKPVVGHTGNTSTNTSGGIKTVTANLAVPANNFNVGGYYDENGNWQVTMGENKQNYTPYIIGAAGLLGVLLISKKRK